MSDEPKQTPSQENGAACEETFHNSIRPPEDNLNHTDVGAFTLAEEDHSLPERPFLMITSTGRYLEGADYSSKRYGLKNYTILFTLSGEGQIQYRNRTDILRRGDVVYICNFEFSRLYTDKDLWEFCFYNIAGSSCRRYDELWNHGGLEIIHIKNPEQYDEYRRQANRMLSNQYMQRELHIHYLLTTIFHELFLQKNSSLAGKREERPAWVKEATDYIAANYNENLPIAVIAKRFSFSADYFSRLFRTYTGHTPKEYQIICRVDEAALLLCETKLSISEIAQRIGFASQCHFAQAFRRIYGKSPSEYRKKSAEK